VLLPPVAPRACVGVILAGDALQLFLQDAAQVSFFVESGRAGSLLESLGGRRALGDTVIPDELRAEERAARDAVSAARNELDKARAAGKRKDIRRARAALRKAQEALLDTVARIQRASKAAANLAYPQAAPLGSIQAALDRVKKKKEQAGITPANTDNLTAAQQEQIEAVERRRDAARKQEGNKD